MAPLDNITSDWTQRDLPDSDLLKPEANKSYPQLKMICSSFGAKDPSKIQSESSWWDPALVVQGMEAAGEALSMHNRNNQ